MKKLNVLKFALNLILGVGFALLFNYRVLGGATFHETAGLAMGFAVLIHLILNAGWVKNVALSIFSKKISAGIRIGFALNLLLLLDLAVILISGIFISKSLFPDVQIQSRFLNRPTHIAASYIGLGLVGIHVGLHWRWAMNGFKKIFRIGGTGRTMQWIARVIAVFVFAFGIYSMVSVHYVQNVSQIVGSGSSARSGSPAFQGSAGNGDGAENNNGNFSRRREGNAAGGSGSGGNAGSPESRAASDLKGTFDRGGPGGGTARSGAGRPGESMDANPAGVLAVYLSIMAVFAMIAYYVEKLLLLQKKANLRKGLGSRTSAPHV